MEKKIVAILVILFITVCNVKAQDSQTEFKPSGKVFGKIFVNYHYDFTEGSTKRNSFNLQRTYLGYKYNYSKKISVKITFDGARFSEASSYTVFLKHAQLDWKVDNNVNLSFGLIGTKQFNDQEKFWGYRYLFKSFQDEFKLGSSADLGVNAQIAITKNLNVNLFVMNGEGYTSVQDMNGRIKAGGNIIYKPTKDVLLKGYFDTYGGDYTKENEIVTDTTSVKTAAFFAGYNGEKFRIGAEYEIQKDGKKFNEQAKDHDLTGFSIYGTYIINNRFEIFVNYLNFQSNKVNGAEQSWNHGKDGSIVLGGIQYEPIKSIKMALNYRTFCYDESSKPDGNFVYLNMEFKF